MVKENKMLFIGIFMCTMRQYSIIIIFNNSSQVMARYMYTTHYNRVKTEMKIYYLRHLKKAIT